MNRRLELQAKLEEILGSRNVYYNPMESTKIEYPAIVYRPNSFYIRKADNKIYNDIRSYTITTLYNSAKDNPVVDKLLNEFEYISYSSHYIADNINHDNFNLYY
ncbi:MAG: hypothetical protein HUJ52_03490 [Malacoplasma sp.]|nr:hypothetical protein [Malacoplasma sp.]